MAENNDPQILKTIFYLAKILKTNELNVQEMLTQIEESVEIDLSQKHTLQSWLWRVRNNVKKVKKSIDELDGDWWNSELDLNIQTKKCRYSNPVESTAFSHRNSL